jgi:tetratricopeptide (TPR) repeat protein
VIHDCVRLLVYLYLQEGRHGEAFAALKRLTTASIPQPEIIDPDLILNVVHEFSYSSLNNRSIDILTMFLGSINRSWDKDKRAKAYLAFGEGYTFLSEYEKAASFLHKALAITEDPERKVDALYQMGYMSTLSCDYDDAIAAMNQALEIISAESGDRTRNKSTERWSKHTAMVHKNIGDALSEQGKGDLEALASFERALAIIKEHRPGDAAKLAATYEGIGVVQARLGKWDEAIDFLKVAHSSIGTDTNTMNTHFRAGVCEQIVRVRLDQYFWDERLCCDTQKRQNILMEAANFSQESMELEYVSYSKAEMKKKKGI